MSAKFLSALVLDDVEYVKVHLSTKSHSIDISTLSGAEIRDYSAPWTLHALMADVFANSHGNTPMSLG
jgi:hypothetical protein